MGLSQKRIPTSGGQTVSAQDLGPDRESAFPMLQAMRPNNPWTAHQQRWDDRQARQEDRREQMRARWDERRAGRPIPARPSPNNIPQPGRVDIAPTLAPTLAGSGAMNAFASQQAPGFDPVQAFLSNLPPLGPMPTNQPAIPTQVLPAPPAAVLPPVAAPVPGAVPGLPQTSPGGRVGGGGGGVFMDELRRRYGTSR